MSVVEQSRAPSVEQVHEHPTPVKPGEGISLSELIQRARNATGEERAWLCTLVNRALNALCVGGGAPGDGAPSAADKDRQAALLLEMLDDEALHGLEDDQGVPCRAVAVEALLTIGYPWALQLEPEDVQFLRDHPAGAPRVIPFNRIAGGGAGLSAALLMGVSLVGMRAWWGSQLVHSATELTLVASLALTMLASFSIVFGRPWTGAARAVMGISSLVTGLLVAANLMTHSAAPIHGLMMVVPVLGAAGAILRDKAKT